MSATPADVAAVMALVWALVRAGPNSDGRDAGVRLAVEAAIDNAVAAERERWKAALRCNDSCPPCRDPKNCKRKAVGLYAYCVGG